MKKGGKQTSKPSRSSQQNGVRGSIRNVRSDPILENETEETNVFETPNKETGVNETPEQEVHTTEEIRVTESHEQGTRVDGQLEDINEDTDSENSIDGDQIDGQEIPPDEPIRRRGPNHGADIPEDLDDRPTIIAIGGRFPDSRVTSDIAVMLQSHFTGPWPTWSKVPEKVKENLWAKFTKHYKWSSWRHHQIRKAWENTNSNRFRDILCGERKRAATLANSDVPANWRNRNPDWIPRRFWNMLIDNVWSTENWQKKSTAGKNNRIKGNEKAEPTYTGGSITIEAHKMIMRKELNRDPTEIELYDRTHRKNRGTGDYVCPKAKTVRETYDKNFEEKYPDPEKRPSFDTKMWSQASGGLSKQRLYGFGPSKRGVSVFGDSHSEWSARSDGSLEADKFDKKIIDVEKMVEDVKMETKGSIKEAKDEIVNFKKELPGLLRAMLQEIQWTNTKYAGGSGHHQQSYSYGDDEYTDDEFSGSDEDDEYNSDRVEFPRKHRVYGNKYDDDYDDGYNDSASYKKSKGGNEKKRHRNNGKSVQQNRKYRKK